MSGFVVADTVSGKRIGQASLDGGTWVCTSSGVQSLVDAKKAAGLSDEQVLAYYQDWSNGYLITSPARQRIDKTGAHGHHIAGTPVEYRHGWIPVREDVHHFATGDVATALHDDGTIGVTVHPEGVAEHTTFHAEDVPSLVEGVDEALSDTETGRVHESSVLTTTGEASIRARPNGDVTIGHGGATLRLSPGEAERFTQHLDDLAASHRPVVLASERVSPQLSFDLLGNDRVGVTLGESSTPEPATFDASEVADLAGTLQTPRVVGEVDGHPITRSIERYAEHDDPTYVWSVIIDGKPASRLWVGLTDNEIKQVETYRREHRGQGYASALYRQASSEMTIYHAPEGHRTADGDRFAHRTGGPVHPIRTIIDEEAGTVEEHPAPVIGERTQIDGARIHPGLGVSWWSDGSVSIDAEQTEVQIPAEHVGAAAQVLGRLAARLGPVLTAKGARWVRGLAKRAVVKVEEGAAGRYRARHLIRWFEHGEGAAKIGWGTPGDFGRCVTIASEHMRPDQAKGWCNLRHHGALGYYPATHAAMERGHQ